MADAKTARAELQRVGGLNDRLHAELAAIGDAVAPIDVRITLAPPAADRDIEAIAFVVLMQAAQSAQEDLKAIMDGVRAINDAKAQQRRSLDERNRPAAPAPRAQELDLDSIVALLGTLLAHDIESDAQRLIAGADALVEWGEQEQLRMQMVMDRVSKLMSAMSNILKKLFDTQSTIVQNIK